MELLSPSPPPRTAADRPPSPATLHRAFGGESSAGSPDGWDGVIHVAVGRSAEKSLGLLLWTFKRFGCREVVLIHVHQPSPMIPTLLGKLPVSQASEELVSAYRREERECTKKILLSYMSICYRAQVEANVIISETGHIQKGIVDLVARHGIQKLVVGAAPESCFKVKGRFSMTTFIAKNAPPFCEICFVSKGKHVWIREATEEASSLLPVSLHKGESMFSPECVRSSHFTSPELQGAGNMIESESDDIKVIVSPSDSSMLESASQISSPTSTSSTGTPSLLTSPVERLFSSVFSPKDYQIMEVIMEAEKSKKKAFAELAKCKKLESETAEAFDRLKALEVAYAHESKLRKELEGQFRTARLKVEELVDERDRVMQELQEAMRTIATLDVHAQEVAHQRDEAAGKVDRLQASIATLKLEKQKILWQREEANPCFERWTNSSQAWSWNCNGPVASGIGTSNIIEFSLSELETATCEFSESFKLRQGGYGCVYKGEILNKTVVIRKLHPHNVHCQSEFQQEVYVLSKLRHPHLVTLVGVCPEALSLVHEYLPNGSLHDHLFCKSTISPLTWKVRTRIAAEISSALHFLHSSKPEKFIHGDLKPENIFLDFDFICKIDTCGISRLVPEDAVDYPLVGRNTEPKGMFSYWDPEYQRATMLMPKSDIYSFGIIVLQLLTGKPPVGLPSEVRRVISVGQLSSILDPSAGEWPISVARKLAEFALQCTEMNSRDRPELTPVVVQELQELDVTEQRPIPSYFLCPILQEIMHDPQVAADGFTYEGSALQGWLQNGRETSPMTNLRLEHLNLTPNHALRFAIQDWLCQSSS